MLDSPLAAADHANRNDATRATTSTVVALVTACVSARWGLIGAKHLGAASKGIAVAIAAVSALGIAAVVGRQWLRSAATARWLRHPACVRWTVARLLERASADDRRGRLSVERVAGLLPTGAPASSVREAIAVVAEALAREPVDAQTIGTRVHRAVAQRAQRNARRWGIVLLALAVADALATALAMR